MTSLVHPRLRARYLGESLDAAKLGIGRDCIGIDRCAPSQQHLRAVVALFLLNSGYMPKPPGDWHLTRVVNYDLTVAPRYDDLIVHTHAAGNVARIFIPNRGTGIPGLRLASIGARNNLAQWRGEAEGAAGTSTRRPSRG